VVGTDFSPGAELALEQALTLAATSNASIALVHAYEDEPGTLPSNDHTSAALLSRLEETILGSGAKDRGIRVDSVVRPRCAVGQDRERRVGARCAADRHRRAWSTPVR
jgi:nucleotide-binding universal stress UspA family protein